MLLNFQLPTADGFAEKFCHFLRTYDISPLPCHTAAFTIHLSFHMYLVPGRQFGIQTRPGLRLRTPLRTSIYYCCAAADCSYLIPGIILNVPRRSTEHPPDGSTCVCYISHERESPAWENLTFRHGFRHTQQAESSEKETTTLTTSTYTP